MNRIVRSAKKPLIAAAAVLLAGTALVASARALTADLAAEEASCVDVGCRSNTQCQSDTVKCDLCHTDNRCALVAEEQIQ